MFAVAPSQIRLSLKGNFHDNGQSSVFGVREFKTKIRSVDLMKPGAHITQTYSFCSTQNVVGSYPRPVVSDLESKQAVKALCFDVDKPSRRARCDRMLDGIFHHRLQNKMGHPGRQRLWFQFKRYS